ncbi:hypothetical protein AMECASPLE_010772 [Ameca splendens]|uniref:Uncharacterized protein n=1 Tax=Ameca splendens TaxID=208324 RepID=A0ABV0XPQ3_9TELE
MADTTVKNQKLGQSPNLSETFLSQEMREPLGPVSHSESGKNASETSTAHSSMPQKNSQITKRCGPEQDMTVYITSCETSANVRAALSAVTVTENTVFNCKTANASTCYFFIIVFT